jgi:hypothetical protein
MEAISYKHLLSEYKEEIEKQLIALCKVAKRVGVPEPTWKFSEEYEFEFSAQVGFTQEADANGSWVEPEHETFIEKVFDIEIDLAQTIKMEGGWSIVAAISHREGVIIQIDENVELPARFKPQIDTCEHCGRSFPRVKSFVVVNEQGEFKQLGKTCMKQFLGVNPISYISMFEAVSKFSNFILTTGYSKNGGGRLDNLAYNVDELLRYTIGTVQREGKFVKAEWEERVIDTNRWGQEITKNFRTNLGYATIDKVKEILSAKIYFRYNENKLAEAQAITQEQLDKIKLRAANYYAHYQKWAKLFEAENTEDYKTAANEAYYQYSTRKEVIDLYDTYQTYLKGLTDLFSYSEEVEKIKKWAADITIRMKKEVDEEDGEIKEVVASNFENFKIGVRESFQKERILQSNLKYICTGYNLYLKDLEYKATNADRLAKAAASTHVGVVGEKSHLVLKVTNYKTGFGTFGTWHLWTLEDAQGNQFKKFGTLDEKHIIQKAENGELVGSTLEALFEIKQHEDFQGCKITQLGRGSKVKNAKYVK